MTNTQRRVAIDMLAGVVASKFSLAAKLSMSLKVKSISSTYETGKGTAIMSMDVISLSVPKFDYTTKNLDNETGTIEFTIGVDSIKAEYIGGPTIGSVNGIEMTLSCEASADGIKEALKNVLSVAKEFLATDGISNSEPVTTTHDHIDNTEVHGPSYKEACCGIVDGGDEW